jgi:hypothetical protein
MRNDHKNLLHACRRYLCPDRTSAVDPDCDGVVRHIEWRRCAFWASWIAVIVAAALSFVGFRAAMRS